MKRLMLIDGSNLMMRAAFGGDIEPERAVPIATGLIERAARQMRARSLPAPRVSAITPHVWQCNHSACVAVHEATARLAYRLATLRTAAPINPVKPKDCEIHL